MAVGVGRVGLLLALALAAPLVGPFAGALSGATGTQTVDETLTAQPGTYQELAGYDVIRASASFEHQGSTLSAPADYNLNTSDGTVRFTESGPVSAGEQVNATYNYEASDPLTSRLLTFVLPILGLLLLGLIASGMKEVP